MRSFREIKQDYRFTPEDEKRLEGMRTLMEEHVDDVMSTLSLWIMGTKGAAKFFTDESRKRHVFGAQREWFLDLFSGKDPCSQIITLLRISSAENSAP